MTRRIDETYKMPIYLKAEQIFKLTEGLAETIPDDDEFLQCTKGFMYENALIISSKIAGAEGGNLYDLRIENAAFIRKAARELYVQAGSLRFHGIKETEYINLLRTEIDEFKLLFVDWVASFDINNYIRDDWGLFNPPGVSPFDEGSFDDEMNLEFDDDDFDDL
jgi:hypothetical protein